MGMIGIGDVTTGPQPTEEYMVSRMTDDQAYTRMTQMTDADFAAMDPAALDLLAAKTSSSAAYLKAAGYTKAGGGVALPTQTKWLLAIVGGFVLIVMMRR